MFPLTPNVRVRMHPTHGDLRIADFKKGTLKLQPGSSAEQTLENELLGILSTVRDAAGKP